MTSIGTKFFTPKQLKTIREAVNPSAEEVKTSTEESSFSLASALPKELSSVPTGKQDVLILAPEDNIFKSEVALSDTLESRGVDIEQDFDDMGVSAQVTPEQAEELKKAGYEVFDNSPRPMWGLPGTTTVSNSSASGDFSMPETKQVEWLKQDQVQEAGLTGKGQTVAVLDSGFDHPEFELAGWKDVVDHSPVPVDLVGHGTHVAHDVLQAAPDADIVAVKVMGNDGSGRPSDIIAGIEYVLEQNAKGADIDIINMSLGGPPDALPNFLHPINRAVERASAAGVTVVAAAGNSGPGPNTIGSPAETASAIAVGAALNPDKVSDFSSRGTEGGFFTATKPDVIAPGEFIAGWSVPGSQMLQTAEAVESLRNMPAPALKELLQENPDLAQGLGIPPEVVELPAGELEQVVKPALPGTYIPEPGLVAAPGTSFAAPLVSGVLASLEEEHDISPKASMTILEATANDMGGQPESVQGKGFVDAKAALDLLQEAKARA